MCPSPRRLPIRLLIPQNVGRSYKLVGNLMPQAGASRRSVSEVRVRVAAVHNVRSSNGRRRIEMTGLSLSVVRVRVSMGLKWWVPIVDSFIRRELEHPCAWVKVRLRINVSTRRTSRFRLFWLIVEDDGSIVTTLIITGRRWTWSERVGLRVQSLWE